MDLMREIFCFATFSVSAIIWQFTIEYWGNIGTTTLCRSRTCFKTKMNFSFEAALGTQMSSLSLNMARQASSSHNQNSLGSCF